MRRVRSWGGVGAGVLCAACIVTGSAPVAAQHSMSAVAFMTGCWEGPFGSGERQGVIEERYTTPSANVLLGTTRYLRDGRAVQFEFTLLEVADGVLVMTPYPRGARSEHSFALTEVAGQRAVFEAPEHDFPKRIIYDGSVEGALTASIDGGEGSTESATWSMKRVPCDPGAGDSRQGR